MKTRSIFTTLLVAGGALAALAPASAQDGGAPLAAPAGGTPPAAQAPLRVIATVPAWGALAREIGGELVDVVELCRPTQDLHAVSATPALMGRVHDGELLLHTGLDAEPWLVPLLRGAGAVELLPGGAHAVDLSQGVPLKDVPVELSRREGDLHAHGNVHIWTDPLVIRGAAVRVRDALVERRPAQADVLQARWAAFHERLTRALIGWLADERHLKGTRVVVHHASWTYFLDRFGLVQAGTIEPKPRVAPTAAHLAQLAASMREQGVRVVVREPFQAPEAAEHVAAATGARVVVLSTHPADGDLVAHFESLLDALTEAAHAHDD